MSTFTQEDAQNVATAKQSSTFVEESTEMLTYTSSKNTGVVVIHIVEDKLKLYLRDHQDSSAYGGYALGLLGILFTLIITLCTVDNFKARLGLTPDYWRALFSLACFLVIYYILKYTWKWYKNRERLKVSNLVKKIKGETVDFENKCIFKRKKKNV